jgi:SAM-dependent methyltransferase
MSGFSADWLALREAADHRARSRELEQTLSARFQTHDSITVVDLGCGTGSNLRATAPLLPERQSWTLVDYDADLLIAARMTLKAWADSASEDGDALELVEDRRRIRVDFRQADLAQDLDGALGGHADLVTASALFDLASPDFIRRFTNTGIQRWVPHRPADNAMASAFHRHQMRDKGLGPSAGPTAPAHLADQFRLSDYTVLEGDSPWKLSAPRDAALIAELAKGFAAAVAETGAVDKATIAAWQKVARTGAETGHTDTLAIPV